MTAKNAKNTTRFFCASGAILQKLHKFTSQKKHINVGRQDYILGKASFKTRLMSTRFEPQKFEKARQVTLSQRINLDYL